MQKIVYLFGAGASCNSLPLVNQIPEQLSGFIGFLEQNLPHLTSDDKRSLASDLVYHLKRFKEVIGSHSSIDVYAKKLFIKKEEAELLRLKLCISAFFTFLQLTKSYDKRYDTFFSSLLKTDSMDLPHHVRVLSWNYDYQFELSFAEFYHDRQISSCSAVLNVVTKYSSNRPRENKFGIFKLNGTAALSLREHFDEKPFVRDFKFALEGRILKIEEILDTYQMGLKLPHDGRPMLSFAWEAAPERYNITDQALSEIKDGSVLVIIGYSFPFFNRDIDRKLVGGMNQLRKVYVQDIVPQKIVERIKAIRSDFPNITIQPYQDTDQFLLPDEL